MKKLNKKSILFMTTLVAGTIAVSSAIACSQTPTPPNNSLLDTRKVAVGSIAKAVQDASLSAKNTYATLTEMNNAVAAVKSFDDLYKILDTTSATAFRSAIGQATFVNNNGAVPDTTKNQTVLKIKISFMQPEANADANITVKFVAPGATTTPKTEAELAKEWYDSVPATNTAADAVKDQLPSAVTEFKAENLKTSLPVVPTGFTSHVKLVADSSEDVNGSLKVNVSLSKGTTWYNSDGATAANEQAVVAKVVTVSGFKNTAQTNAEKAVAYYKSLPESLALTDTTVAQTLPSAVTQDVLNGFVSKAPAAPEGLTVSLLLVAEGAKDSDGTLTVKVVLAETDTKLFNVEGGEVDKKESAGKDIVLSGFKVKEAEKNPGQGQGQGGQQQVDPTIALVKAWFETVTETKALENATTILPASVTQENLETTVGSLWVAPADVEGATVVLTLESVDNDTGTLKVKVGLKKAEKWYSLEGVLQDTEAYKEVTVTNLQTTAEAVKEIYNSQGTTIEVSSTRSAKEAS
ncbi:hypothetical protein CJJ23_03670 [Mycoplasmopsis agassizii]|uniref:Lipoprotein-associated type-17 domain-containing protein n=1 Tax=Mycoplasmopsis agassizii TaxID=33922 RepID=A0A269TJD1_9BACT|nr:lipoprotein 17-related variable surface protein [Mycoplasmopsis agassizii]PAK21136.1 hypothetical protein CJJ23_03670 [Mycoplasmopsis agassizii]